MMGGTSSSTVRASGPNVRDTRAYPPCIKEEKAAGKRLAYKLEVGDAMSALCHVGQLQCMVTCDVILGYLRRHTLTLYVLSECNPSKCGTCVAMYKPRPAQPR